MTESKSEVDLKKTRGLDGSLHKLFDPQFLSLTTMPVRTLGFFIETTIELRKPSTSVSIKLKTQFN